MRTLIILAVPMVLAGCWQSPAAEPEPEGSGVECALDGTEVLKEDCTLEVRGTGGEFVIHHPDGGFRRFAYDTGGGYTILDGADALVVRDGPEAPHVEFTVGDDRYLVPRSLITAAPR
ncbi:hypothetical protein [Qipengyuania sp. MTN3-11]|uniref:hypothetical protein n=1 Tax=Qipengyuania sp. MTN3-11 TaxID=3056557 RepID=UPI0036F2D513